MARFPCFLSVVLVIRNYEVGIRKTLVDATDVVAGIVDLYELIIIDNASGDNSVSILKQLTCEDGLANLQVFALTKEVDSDTASWIGLENALGDFVVTIDPFADDIGFVPRMLEIACSGADVVFADNRLKARQRLPYRIAYALFNRLYRALGGVHLAREAPQFRILSKRLVNFILRHPQPAMTYRHLPVTGGFTRRYLCYSAVPKAAPPKRLAESIDRGMKLLVSTTYIPMRLVTLLSLLGAGANLLYCMYVVGVGIFKADVAPGWISVSLQQSGMFFLISLVLLVLGEYILNMVSVSSNAPRYHVAQEFTSARMTSREKLNVQEAVHSASSGEHTFP
jgi:glycosyltransferase involved in cell wall biosynthesis